MQESSVIENMAYSAVYDASSDADNVIEVDDITGAEITSSLKTQDDINSAIATIVDSYNNFITRFDEIGGDYYLQEATVENLKEIVLLKCE